MGIIVRQERCLISSPTVSQISPTPASFIGSALRIPNACSHLRQAAQALASTSCDDLTCNPRSPTLNCCQPCVRHAEQYACSVPRVMGPTVNRRSQFPCRNSHCRAMAYPGLSSQIIANWWPKGWKCCTARVSGWERLVVILGLGRE